jgi:hypothetical protein
MFNLLRNRRQGHIARQQATILAECEKELQRASGISWQFVGAGDVSKGRLLIEKATAAGLKEHETVRRLAFLQRLWTAALDDEVKVAATVKDALLAEAAAYELSDISVARFLQRRRGLELLHERGPSVVTHDAQGRPVYFQCEAEFKNKSGRLAFRDDGLTFTGEVVVEVAWGNVLHVAKTTHTYQGYDLTAIALQEGKRRTATKFALPLGGEADYACDVAVLLWERNKRRHPRVQDVTG